MSVISFQRFLVPVYHWRTVKIMITDVNFSGIGSRGSRMGIMEIETTTGATYAWRHICIDMYVCVHTCHLCTWSDNNIQRKFRNIHTYIHAYVCQYVRTYVLQGEKAFKETQQMCVWGEASHHTRKKCKRIFMYVYIYMYTHDICI